MQIKEVLLFCTHIRESRPSDYLNFFFASRPRNHLRLRRIFFAAVRGRGLRGGSAYFQANKDALHKQFAAIETDGGVGRTFGVMGSVRRESEKYFAPLQLALQPIGAGNR